MRKAKNIAQHIAEYLLAAVFLLAAYSEIVYRETEAAEGVLAFLFADPIVTVIYAVWFTGMALTLLVSKWFKKKRLHKHVLVAMYMTTVYTITLTLAVLGFGVEIIDDGIIAIVAAWCWLRWKLLTEYIDADKFYEQISDLRDDLP